MEGERQTDVESHEVMGLQTAYSDVAELTSQVLRTLHACPRSSQHSPAPSDHVLGSRDVACLSVRSASF